MARVDQLGRPPAAIDRELVVGGQQVLQDPSTGLSPAPDEEQLVGRATGCRVEAPRIGRLMERVDRRAGLIRHLRREAVGRHERQVVSGVQVGPGQLGVADLPEDTNGARLTRRLVQPEEVEDDIIDPHQRAIPEVPKPRPPLPAGTPQGIAKGPREMRIAPRLRGSRMRSGDPDPDARRTQPALHRRDHGPGGVVGRPDEHVEIRVRHGVDADPHRAFGQPIGMGDAWIADQDGVGAELVSARHDPPCREAREQLVHRPERHDRERGGPGAPASAASKVSR